MKNLQIFVLDQLSELGEFETKKMFGGLALIYNGSAFGEIKHNKVWLKVKDSNRENFTKLDMQQYTFGKNNSRKLNFYETPVDVLEDKDKFIIWARNSIEIIT